LAALDAFVNKTNIDIVADKVEESVSEFSVPLSTDISQTEVSDKADTLKFEISEEEASELAIVHDEALTNPANNDNENLIEAGSAQITPIRFSKNTNIEAIDDDVILAETPCQVSASAVTPRALVVDDSPSVRKQLELELELFDVDVDYAATAKEAMDFLGLEKYDVAFLDVVLPDKDGFSICRHIKETSEDTSVIMLTGKAKQADKVKGALAGCDAYMVKPVGRLTFQSTVRNYLTLIDSSSVVEA
jgi:CheY-like chemotaxis protein